MTEAEWAVCADPQWMLSFLWGRGQVSDRKSELFDAACCRRLGDWLWNDVLREAVSVVEDGRKSHFDDDDYVALRDNLERAVYAVPPGGDPSVTVPRNRAALAVSHAFHGFGTYRLAARSTVAALVAAGHSRSDEQRVQAELIRDIFGNPFTPVAVRPEWRTEAVVALARGIYDERAWDRMGVLADALDDAGCDSVTVLDHCRGPNAHARGCWVVDAVLGLE